jgi:hypothetical protein
MLSAGKLGRGQEPYYLEKVADGAEDYYSGEGEAPGQWKGDAAAELGLSGEIEPDQLVAILTGQNPTTGEPLGLRHVEGGAVPGFDLTFSAPKSVSLTWALAGPPVGAEVAEAHAAAVEAGLDYLQEVACLTRRGAGVPGRSPALTLLSCERLALTLSQDITALTRRLFDAEADQLGDLDAQTPREAPQSLPARFGPEPPFYLRDGCGAQASALRKRFAGQTRLTS